MLCDRKTEHLLLEQLLDFVACWMLENMHCSIEFAQFQAAAEVEAVAVTKKLIQIICKIPRFLGTYRLYDTIIELRLLNRNFDF